MNRILDGMTLTEQIWFGTTVLAVAADLLLVGPVLLFVAGGYPALNAAIGMAGVHFGGVLIAALHTPFAISMERKAKR